MGGRIFATSTGFPNLGDLLDTTIPKDLHVIDLARRPNILATAAIRAEVPAVMRSSSPIAVDERGDSPPAIRRTGTSASSVQKLAGTE